MTYLGLKDKSNAFQQKNARNITREIVSEKTDFLKLSVHNYKT
jgi:hypothetical protein